MRLMQDLHSTVVETAAVNADSQKRFMRLCSCTEAILFGCGQRAGSDLQGQPLRKLSSVHIAFLGRLMVCHSLCLI